MTVSLTVVLFLPTALLFCAHCIVSETILWGPKILNENREQPGDSAFFKRLHANVDKVVVFVSEDNVTFSDKETFNRIKNIPVLVTPDSLNSFWNTWNDLQYVTLGAFNVDRKKEILDIFSTVEAQYGEGRVLGILQIPNADKDHIRVRRRVSTKHYTLDYNKDGDILLRVTDPTLYIYGSKYKLYQQSVTTGTDKSERLAISFDIDNNQVMISFNFEQDGANWTMTSAEYYQFSDERTYLLPVDKNKDVPKAPLGQFYKCDDKIVFKNDEFHLEFGRIEVQPYLNGQGTFSKEGVICPRPIANTLQIIGWVALVAVLLCAAGGAIWRKRRAHAASRAAATAASI